MDEMKGVGQEETFFPQRHFQIPFSPKVISEHRSVWDKFYFGCKEKKFTGQFGRQLIIVCYVPYNSHQAYCFSYMKV